MMRYPILIEPGSENSAFGVVLPDLPGCFSAGDTLDEAVDAVKEAAALWIDSALDSGEVVPPPSDLDSMRRRPEFAGWIVGIVELDPALFDDAIERVNITLPRRILRRLDAMATAQRQSRGAFIADLTLKFARPPG
jgi:predicted RNase H-like HicB family nuclease